jgi:VWFA-related protein
MLQSRISMLVVVSAWAATAQAPKAPSTVIQTETRMVLVDAVVTDKKGNYITDLTQKDFKVLEDNREQAIRSFSAEADPTSPSRDQKRYLVLFFDDTSMELRDQTRVRAAAGKFVETNSGPNRLVALVNFSGGGIQILQNFTDDTERLKRVVSDLKFAAAASGAPPTQEAAQLTTTAADFAARGLILTLRGLARNMSSIAGRKTLVVFTGGFPVSPAQLPELNATLDVCNRANVAVYPIDLRGLDNPGATVISQRDLTGTARQSAPLIQGTVPDPRNDAPASKEFPTAAPLSSAADEDFSAARPPWASRASGQYSKNNTLTNRQIMNSLAEGTGGFVITSGNDLTGGLDRIAKEQTQYYVLGYTPPPNEDRNCHELHVKVDRGGMNVRARTGYCNAKAVDALAGKPIEKELESRAAGSQPGNAAASMQLPFFYTARNQARVNVALDIATASLKFEKQKGKPHAVVSLLAIASTVEGSIGARFSDTLNLDFADNKELEKFQQRPLHYETQFEIAPGKYNVKLAFSAGGEWFGRLELPLTVDPYDPKEFALSGLALSKEVRRAADAGVELEASLLQDKTPLIASGLQVVPSGTNQFAKAERSMFYFEVYEPLLVTPDPKNPVLVAIQMRVLDRKTGQQKSDSGLMRIEMPKAPGNPVIPVALKLPVQDLPPGAYSLELMAADTADKMAIRAVDFEIK